jgi:Tol biopolymer transport system component
MQHMKRLIFTVFLASAILASCTKDEITPYTPLDPNSPTNPVAPKLVPYGTVKAPFIAVSLQDAPGSEFKIEKYNGDGSFRAALLDGYFSGSHFIANPDFSLFGDKFCFAEGQSIYIMDVNTLQRQEVIGNVNAAMGILSTELSPDGSMIAYLTRNTDNTSDLNIVGSTGEMAPVKLTDFLSTNSSAGPPSFSPDGSMITYEESANIVVSDINGANKFRITKGSSQTASYPIFNADGSRLIYFLNQDHGFTLVSSEVREGAGDDQVMLSFLSLYSISNASHPVLSSDGNTIFFAGTASGFINLYKVSATGGVPERVAFNIANSGEYMLSGLDFIGRKAE